MPPRLIPAAAATAAADLPPEDEDALTVPPRLACGDVTTETVGGYVNARDVFFLRVTVEGT